MIIRNIRHRETVGLLQARRRPTTNNSVVAVAQTIQRLGMKLDRMQAKVADTGAKLERIAPVVAVAAEQKAMRDAWQAETARQAERRKAIRDGRPIRPETTAEMAAIHARHYERCA